MKQLRRTITLIVVLLISFSLLKLYFSSKKNHLKNKEVASEIAWKGPDMTTDTSIKGEDRSLIIYGHDLIAHTSKYLGPNGTVAKITNGMNCQNCHLNAGNQPWGNNYGAVYSTYPKYRDRSGQIESIYKRVSDCMERSLNGKALDSNSKEFAAINNYVKYLGKYVQKDSKPIGSGIEKIQLLERSADPQKGQIIYTSKCQICHGNNGQGKLLANNQEYAYPPVWGEHSYNDGAGLFRISNLAGYIKNNMPFLQTSHENPVLTDEQCWDLASYINSKPRPHMNQSMDWPNIKKKPFDYPFGPYADSFSEEEHKFGPFQLIIKNSSVK
jgi:thiosulfate dehydrogenase